MEIYNFYYKFLIVYTPPDEVCKFDAFNTASQLFTTRPRKGIWSSLISKYYATLPIVVYTPSKGGCKINAFNTDSQLFTPHLGGVQIISFQYRFSIVFMRFQEEYKFYVFNADFSLFTPRLGGI